MHNHFETAEKKSLLIVLKDSSRDQACPVKPQWPYSQENDLRDNNTLGLFQIIISCKIYVEYTHIHFFFSSQQTFTD